MVSPGTPEPRFTVFSILLITQARKPSGFFLKKKPPCTICKWQNVNRKRSSHQETHTERVNANAETGVDCGSSLAGGWGKRMQGKERIGQGQLHKLKNRVLPRIEVAFLSQSHSPICQSLDSLSCKRRLGRPHR
jgi:hypothetical protein